MGGAAGHLKHVYEDLQLTFGDLKDILRSAAEGRLRRVTEKLDGINLMFTFDPITGLRVARTTSDIKKGGLTARDLTDKFAGRGNIEDAFMTGFHVLSVALSSLKPETSFRIFKHGSRWYSLELIYSGFTNVIKYDKNHIVFHDWPIYISSDGEITRLPASLINNETKELKHNIFRMQTSIDERNWKIHGPISVSLKRMCDQSILSDALREIDNTMSIVNVYDHDTLQDYVYSHTYELVKGFGATSIIANMVGERVALMEGRHDLNTIKQACCQEDVKLRVADLVRSERKLRKDLIEPIERTVSIFSSRLLQGMDSKLVENSTKELERQRNNINASIKNIQESNDQQKVAVLTREMKKLRSVNNVSSTLEGIVFVYKGNAFKLTGSFTSAHRIMSLTPAHNDKRSGGRVFSNVEAITSDEYVYTFKHVIDDMLSLGATNVLPIGTTGKKSKTNDIDITCQHKNSMHEFYVQIRNMFGTDNTKNVGRNISIRYPIFDRIGPTKRYVQVDIMPGDSKFISWGRYAPSPEKDSPEYSPVKGVIRNLLLNDILRVSSEKIIGLNRKRYAIDFDRGLYKIEQTKKGKTRTLKNWKTIHREFVSSNPDEICKKIFGEETKAQDVLTFEQTLHVMFASEKTKRIAKLATTELITTLMQHATISPKFFTGDPYETIDYIKSLVTSA